MTKVLTTELIDTAYINHVAFMNKVAIKKKYVIEERDEQTMFDTIQRVCDETNKLKLWSAYDGKDIQDMMESSKFILAGSILCGIGEDSRNVSMSNCYLTKIESDDIESIFETTKKLARTYSYRGGSGADITILRPSKASVNNAALTSSGAVSFMPLLNTTTTTIGQEGRRGALIITIDIRHPDSLKFIWCKANSEEVFGVDALTGNVQNVDTANISLKLTDEFMRAVEEDTDWSFRFPSLTELFGVIPDTEHGVSIHQSTGKVLTKYNDLTHLRIVSTDQVVEIDEIDDEFIHTKDRLVGRCGSVDIEVGNVYRGKFKASKRVYNELWDGDYDKWRDEYHQQIEVHQTLPAREVFRQLAEAAHKIGDPGVMFIDTVQKYTPGTQIDEKLLKPMGCNPCGEQCLPYYGNCLLGSQVWYKYVKNPYTELAEFDVDNFLKDTRRQVYLLNAVHELNINKHPLKEQRQLDRYSKRIGIELTGLGDTLAMLGISYGSDESLVFIEDLMRKKAIAEIEASLELAVQHGCAPAFDDIKARERFLLSPYIERLELPDHLVDAIREHGLRNTAFNTAGPTGTISMIVGNCTSGIEPLYKFNYTVATRLDDEVTEVVHGPALEWLYNNKPKDICGKLSISDIKDKLGYVEAHELDYHKRINVQASLQKYCDTSISSTINLPEEATVEDIENIYMEAWKKKLKGITIFRNNCKKGVYGDVTTEEEETDNTPQVTNERILMDLEQAERFRVHWKGAKVYIIVSIDDDGTPVEIFAKLPRELGEDDTGNYNEQLFHENQSVVDALARNISLSLRFHIPLERIVKQLDKSSHSMVDIPGIFSRILKRYLGTVKINGHDKKVNVLQDQKCPGCGEDTYVLESGCGACRSCGYSSCG